MQKVRYWARRAFEFAVVFYVLSIFFLAGAEATHNPVLPDKVPAALIHPAAHTK